MEFKRATAFDSPGISALENEIFPDPWSCRAITDCICTEGAMCFVAKDERGIVAYVLGRLIAPEGEIYRVAVRPESRKRGIGYRLLDYSVKTSRGAGLESLFLEVRSKNTAAINLYSAYGFKRIGTRKNYYKNPDDDAILMLLASRVDMEFI